jgi:hypothetical protein
MFHCLAVEAATSVKESGDFVAEVNNQVKTYLTKYSE